MMLRANGQPVRIKRTPSAQVPGRSLPAANNAPAKSTLIIVRTSSTRFTSRFDGRGSGGLGTR